MCRLRVLIAVEMKLVFLIAEMEEKWCWRTLVEEIEQWKCETERYRSVMMDLNCCKALSKLHVVVSFGEAARCDFAYKNSGTGDRASVCLLSDKSMTYSTLCNTHICGCLRLLSQSGFQCRLRGRVMERHHCCVQYGF